MRVGEGSGMWEVIMRRCSPYSENLHKDYTRPVGVNQGMIEEALVCDLRFKIIRHENSGDFKTQICIFSFFFYLFILFLSFFVYLSLCYSKIQLYQKTVFQIGTGQELMTLNMFK